MPAFSLPDLTSVPVIGTVLSIALDTFECIFGYPPATSGSGLAVLGAGIILRLGDLNLGVLELASLEVSLEYHDQNDPLGPGYEQKAFSITSLLADGILTVSVSYDSHAGTLTASLKGSVCYLDRPLCKDPSFGLTSLHVLYTDAVTGLPAIPTSLNIVGTIEIDTTGAVFTISCIADSGQSATPCSTATVSLSINPLSDRINPKSTNLTLSNFVGLLGISSPSILARSSARPLTTFSSRESKTRSQ